MKHDFQVPRSWQRGKIARNLEICRLYASRKYTTKQIAEAFKVTRRQVQLIVKAAGVARTQAEANRVAAPLKAKRRIRRRFVLAGYSS